jgi:hypothetical protein
MVEATNHHPAFGPLSQVDAGLLRVGYADEVVPVPVEVEVAVPAR